MSNIPEHLLNSKLITDQQWKEYQILKKTLKDITIILKESNVIPSTDCRLFLEDGYKIVKLIEDTCKTHNIVL